MKGFLVAIALLLGAATAQAACCTCYGPDCQAMPCDLVSNGNACLEKCAEYGDSCKMEVYDSERTCGNGCVGHPQDKKPTPKRRGWNPFGGGN